MTLNQLVNLLVNAHYFINVHHHDIEILDELSRDEHVDCIIRCENHDSLELSIRRDVTEDILNAYVDELHKIYPKYVPPYCTIIYKSSESVFPELSLIDSVKKEKYVYISCVDLTENTMKSIERRVNGFKYNIYSNNLLNVSRLTYEFTGHISDLVYNRITFLHISIKKPDIGELTLNLENFPNMKSLILIKDDNFKFVLRLVSVNDVERIDIRGNIIVIMPDLPQLLRRNVIKYLDVSGLSQQTDEVFDALINNTSLDKYSRIKVPWISDDKRKRELLTRVPLRTKNADSLLQP